MNYLYVKSRGCFWLSVMSHELWQQLDTQSVDQSLGSLKKPTRHFCFQNSNCWKCRKYSIPDLFPHLNIRPLWYSDTPLSSLLIMELMLDYRTKSDRSVFNLYSGDLNTDLIWYSNGQKRLNAKWSGFPMPFEYRRAWLFEFRTNGCHVVSYVLVRYSNSSSST